MFSRLLACLSLALATSALVVTNIIPPASKGLPFNPATAIDLSDTVTDTDTIISTAQTIDQKSGPTGSPDQPVPDTAVTAVDGQITTAGSANSTDIPTRRSFSRHAPSRRSPRAYELAFSGSGTGPSDRDASIHGTAFLTFTTVNNATYNIADCEAFCDTTDNCVFVNLFFEHNNPHLDAGPSNLICAAFADVHTAAEKTNFGGQQLAALPAGKTFIQNSSGFSLTSLVDPVTPEGYELIFGPINAATNAQGYMGFAFLDRFDVDACAQQCNARGADAQGGECQFFNIWRALVNGIPTTYTCAMYFIPTNASTADNFGQGNLLVTLSRGYQRINQVLDGGFEGFTACDDFCFAESDGTWIGTSPAGGTLDATLFFFQPFAHSGNAVALLGSATASDALAGTLTPAAPLNTLPGRQYSIGFFHSSSFSPPDEEAAAFVDVQWNGETIATIHPGFSNFQFFQFSVTAQGQDVLSLHGGAAPAWSFIDDITVFEL
ncbi:hypothetical protein BJ912DRAFT_649320 [Pholiota molesta]|nr:hypothetical protein BJ912DRAFT_649320 [Pholiota molesta]